MRSTPPRFSLLSALLLTDDGRAPVPVSSSSLLPASPLFQNIATATAAAAAARRPRPPPAHLHLRRISQPRSPHWREIRSSAWLASHATQADEATELASSCDCAEVPASQQIVSESSTAGSSTEHLVSCEIKPLGVDEDIETIDANEETHFVIQDCPQCRICLDNEGDDLIAPCHCKGTQKYVHRSCLDNWRSTKEGFAFSHCTECRAAFLLRANVPPDRWWLRLKFQLLVVRDHTFYGDELREMFGYEEHPYAFYAMAILAIVLVGLLYGFFIAIICGQRITERHYHVLAKQELTKEYIVEDLEGTDGVPDLDPNHVTELRILGLY
uniref:RING-CH-type domain-containing protein n=1 Tax=Oryza glumipatula TaxID=40148 RepID=A0A0D9YLV7_9ORYZ